MKHIFILLLTLFFSCTHSRNDDLTLWYSEPAGSWNEALPVGNGVCGAMVFGSPLHEHLQLNENTLYSGDPSVVYKGARVTQADLDRVVALEKKGEYLKAYNEIIAKKFLGRLHQYYQPFGDLHITLNSEGEVSNYRRELNLANAVATTAFTIDGVRHRREIFASHPDNALVLRLKSDKPVDFSISFSCPHPTATVAAEDNCLVMKGKAPGYVERRTFEQIERFGDQQKHPELYDAAGKRLTDKRILYGDEIDGKGMPFEARLQTFIIGEGMATLSDSGTLHISDASEVVVLVALATGFNGYDKSPVTEGINPSEKTSATLQAATNYDYENLKARHIFDYQSLFNRVRLSLPSSPEQRGKPTDRRIIDFAEQPDPSLAALLFQYGRYLMISGSRQGGQPLNLQGLWNREVVPPWNCGYTQNINTEMNYWPAEPTNLSECHEPLFRLISELSVTGGEAAREMYGRQRGWVAHHNTSIWREALPNDDVMTASFWPMAQGWYASHLWEHYLFTDDEQFLRSQAYPLMRGAAEFFADWLIESDSGYLVTPAGLSPENAFISDKGERAAISMGTTMDMTLIRETFANTIRAAEALGVDEALRAELNDLLKQLLPFRIGRNGQLQEWMYDFKEADPRHRHISHLYGLYPGNQITCHTPDLYAAAAQSLRLRGDEATGWSMGWKINCWARLHDGNHAYTIIRNLFNPVDFQYTAADSLAAAAAARVKRSSGGLYKSMLDAHPPFQIDGNFGYTAGVAEMLLQSHAGYIELLPALPDVWSEGAVEGLKARGAFTVSIDWRQGALSSATIVSNGGNQCRIRAAQPFTVKKDGQTIAQSAPVDACHEAEFATVKNERFVVTPAAQ